MFKTDKIAILIGGGPKPNFPILGKDLEGLPIIAVDSGLDACMTYSIKPDYFVGDMDSVSLNAKKYAKKNKIPTNLIFEQDTTDFEKALIHVDASGYVCIGFLDGRFDHSLACLHVVQKYSQKRPILMYGLQDVVLTGANDFSISLPVGERISIWPLGSVHFKHSSGLSYPLKDLEMFQGTQIGTSNSVCENCVRITVSEENNGTYLIILPNIYFDELLTLIGSSFEPK